MNDIQTLLKQAHAAAGNGQLNEAEAYLKQVLTAQPDQSDTLGMLGQLALAQNDPKSAATYFERLTKSLPDNPWVYFDLGNAYEQMRDWNTAAQAYLSAWKINPNNARYAMFLGAALYEMGDTARALQIWSLGADHDPMVRAAHQNPNADAPTKAKSLLADKMLRQHFTAQHINSLDKCDNPERLRSSLWPQTHNGPVRFENKQLNPWIFYAPDLPSTPVFDCPDLAWVQELQSAYIDIRNEYLTYMRGQTEPNAPYLAANMGADVSCDHLIGQQTWTAVHLYKDGAPQACLEHFPKTKAAFENVPVVIFNGQPMEIFFSVLKPNIHIPPHFGTANTRLTAHLPLIIPSDKCRIRVADHTHYWTEGELFLFDDGWDHEAWNDSDETRVVLIFEAWRPDLSAEEIKAIQTSFEDRDSWLKAREIPESI